MKITDAVAAWRWWYRIREQHGARVAATEARLHGWPASWANAAERWQRASLMHRAQVVADDVAVAWRQFEVRDQWQLRRLVDLVDTDPAAFRAWITQVEQLAPAMFVRATERHPDDHPNVITAAALLTYAEGRL